MEIAIHKNGLDDLSGSLERLRVRLAASRTALGAAIKGLDVVGGDSSYTAAARQQLQQRLRTDDKKYEAVIAAEKDIAAFAEYARGVDCAVAGEVLQSTESFLCAHPWLRPAPEQPWYKKALDAVGKACRNFCGAVAEGFHAAVNFIVTNLDTIVNVVNGCLLAVGVAATVAAVVITALSGGTLAGIGAILLKVGLAGIKYALIGAAFGGAVGGVVGGLTAKSWEGALSGAWQGAKEGAIGGFAGGVFGAGLSAFKAGWAAASAFVSRGGTLTFKNFSWRSYSPQEVYTAARPGMLKNPDVLPEKRITHEFFGDKTGGGHALNIDDTGRSLQNAVSLEQAAGQPKGVYNAGFLRPDGKLQIKTVWPNSYSPSRIMQNMDEAYRLAISGKGEVLHTAGSRISYRVQLKDKIFTRIAIDTNTGELITCFPEGMLRGLVNTLKK